MQQDLMGTLAPLDHPAALELLEHLEVKAQQVCKEHQVLQVPLVVQVLPGSRGQQVLQVNLALLD